MKRDTLTRLLARQRDHRPAVLVTHLPSGAQVLIADGTVTARDAIKGGAWPADDALFGVAAEALRNDKGRRWPKEGAGEGDFFIQPFNPPKRMILVGAVHIAQKLAPMATLADFDVTIVDPRGAFASAERFPGVTLVSAWPDDALQELAPDPRTAVVTLTHDPKLDDPALAVALASDAFYIGALGSRRTHARRIERLAEFGLSDAQCARIHAPVGLSLGARSPAEIAISILAQVTQVLHRAPTPETAS